MINPQHPASKYTQVQLVALEILDQQTETSERWATDPDALKYQSAEERLTYAKECRANVWKLLNRPDAAPLVELMAYSRLIYDKVASVHGAVTASEAQHLEELETLCGVSYDPTNSRFQAIDERGR